MLHNKIIVKVTGYSRLAVELILLPIIAVPARAAYVNTRLIHDTNQLLSIAKPEKTKPGRGKPVLIMQLAFLSCHISRTQSFQQNCHIIFRALVVASVPGLPRSVRVLIMRRRQTFEIKTRTERGRPGTEATLVALKLLVSLISRLVACSAQERIKLYK